MAAAALVYATVDDVGSLTRVSAPTPPEVIEDLTVRNATDDRGRSVSFRMLLINDELRWEAASFERLERRPAPEFTAEMKRVLDSAAEIICVGASSEEMPFGLPVSRGRALEEQRAARRAERIAGWVQHALSKPIAVRKLNVGHHVRLNAGRDTSDQRRMAIILVLDRDEGADIDQALHSAMTGERLGAPIFETLLTRYSLAARNRPFTWVE